MAWPPEVQQQQAQRWAQLYELREAINKFANNQDVGDASAVVKLVDSREFELFLIGIAGFLVKHDELFLASVLMAKAQAFLPHLAEDR
jgi:hypothetical protein